MAKPTAKTEPITDDCQDAEWVKFKCYFTQILSAVKMGSDVMRLTIEVPKSEVPNAIPLLGMQDMTLEVWVRAAKDAPTKSNGKTSRDFKINKP